ncbi:transcriptional regulator [Pseudomonas putida]|uniref:transcriptional regulator n=1 Tax=Pseudomonas putida TaxID=303 RepID=UPI0018E6AF1B|nr:transcriptional regulator [Pseudomonas putida]MBI6926103.1 transcriptional regulator [Pseudomonas putida]
MQDFFPVACADMLMRVGLLVKAQRLALGIRQADIKAAFGISPHLLRKVEQGSPNVDLRSFMLVLWRLGINDTVFRTREDVEHSAQMARIVQPEDDPAQLSARRVRLPKSKPEAF